MMAKLLRVLIALTSFILLYNLINGRDPEFLKNQGLSANQINETTTEAVKAVIGELAPDLQLSTGFIATRFEMNNTQVLTNGLIIPDVKTDIFIAKIGDYSLSAELRTVKRLKGEENSFEIKHRIDVFIENNWIVFEPKGKQVFSYFAKVIGLDCKHPDKQYLLEFICMKSEPIITGVKIIEVTESEKGTFQFKDKKYSYLKTIYKASTETTD